MSQHGGCSHGPELSWLEWQRGRRGAGVDGPGGAGTAPCTFLLHTRLKAEAPSRLCRGLRAVLGSGGAGGRGRSWCLTWGFVLSVTQPAHAGAAVAPLLCALGACQSVLSAGVLRALCMWPFTSLRLGCVCRQSSPPAQGCAGGCPCHCLPKSLLIPPVPPAHPVDGGSLPVAARREWC